MPAILTLRRFSPLHQRLHKMLRMCRGIADGVLRKAGNFKVVAGFEVDNFFADVAFAG